MAAALPVIESVVKECIESRNRQSSESPAVQPGPSVPDRPSTQESTETVVRDNPTFQAIIQSGIESSSTLTAVPENNFPLGIARPKAHMFKIEPEDPNSKVRIPNWYEYL
uniref:Uncharacterized protein n=1 Tax=Magallana gigas TaxID=29159 RepID=A0A8W8M190_MAGGI